MYVEARSHCHVFFSIDLHLCFVSLVFELVSLFVGGFVLFF